MAENKIQANSEAFVKITELRKVVMAGTSENMLKVFENQMEWLFKNRLFFPVNFYSKWFSLREIIHKIQFATEDPEAPKNSEDKQRLIKGKMDLKKSVEHLLDEAEKEVLKDVRVKPLSRE